MGAMGAARAKKIAGAAATMGEGVAQLMVADGGTQLLEHGTPYSVKREGSVRVS